MTKSSSVIVGSILENRYRILRELGRGGFGRSFLAEDIQQHNRRCVIKEFAPQVKSKDELRKAKELFAREAGMLSSLQHPQIPSFQELLWVDINGKDSLLIVQDYIEGSTYWELLQTKGKFSEAEVTQLLRQILPVLEYIHGKNLIHRDISPDNIIQRNSDKLPVLIDFGSVKQIAANAIAKATGIPGTVIGKPGFAPDEQMQQGKASVAGDLYALAVTILVLLTNKNPRDLYDIYNAKWIWQKEVKVSPNLAKVLDKMLAHRMIDRYQSVQDVYRDLGNGGTSQNPHNICQIGTVASPAAQQNQGAKPNQNNHNISQMGTVVAAPGNNLPN
ncbi:MAG TPA: serine/threonine protein kinase, partial [Cyanobacteria bacterium UBA9226]|nr:serine/threonine protein kinase [Cyanobacteria bacterium UBA9226]